ncbi:hypothetical protein H4R35_002956 [Dimargaris xerosporica]|nr:hypothetical protein H4R35_002956 [Dimargaris xerosporica]
MLDYSIAGATQATTAAQDSDEPSIAQGALPPSPPRRRASGRRLKRRLSTIAEDQHSIWAQLYGAIMDSADLAQRHGGTDFLKYRTVSHISNRDYILLSQCRERAPPSAVVDAQVVAATTGADEDVYIAPCEHHPSKCARKYLINDNIPKISTELSKVEFGIHASDFTPLAFKTVASRCLADREFSILKKVRDLPHVLHLEDSFIDDANRRVLVLPVVKKINIFHRDLIEIQTIMTQLFTALHGIHRRGITHLDINPANLMSDAKDNLILIDFGLASDSDTDKCLPSCGTPGFVAPEVLRETATGCKADMYSVGIVLGMMLEDYFSYCDLQYLGGSMVRASTTDQIIAQLEDILTLRPDQCHDSRLSPLANAWDYSSNSPPSWLFSSHNVPTIIYDAADLLKSLLQADPAQRISDDKALKHPFITATPDAFANTNFRTFEQKWGSYFHDQLRARTPPIEPFDSYLGDVYSDNYVIYY